VEGHALTSVNGDAAARLATRLRELREFEWADVNLTQVKLATALGQERRVAPATLSSWENEKNPKPPPIARLNAYARFFATRRSLAGGPHLLALNELDEKERERFDELEEELLELHAASVSDEYTPPGETTRRLLLDFNDPEPLPGPIAILCPETPRDSQGGLADESSINYTRLHRFADADALLESFGHIRSLNPKRQVLHRIPREVRKSDLQGHLVILGGIGWNPTLRRIQSELVKRLPIEQVEDPSLSTGEVFRVRKGDAGDEQTYFPRTEEVDGQQQLVEDIGLIARLPNPFNSRRTLTICNGVHSTGVLGAVLALTDEYVRLGNETYLADRFPSGEFAMLVWVPVLSGTALAPDLMNRDARIFEWSPTAGD
jgi:transcriptional regulator with XRE-family HTH domain